MILTYKGRYPDLETIFIAFPIIVTKCKLSIDNLLYEYKCLEVNTWSYGDTDYFERRHKLRFL